MSLGDIKSYNPDRIVEIPAQLACDLITVCREYANELGERQDMASGLAKYKLGRRIDRIGKIWDALSDAIEDTYRENR